MPVRWAMHSSAWACRKRITVHWNKLGQQLQHASPQDGLDDVMVLDLGYLCQRMQPPVETHHKCACQMPCVRCCIIFQACLVWCASRRQPRHEFSHRSITCGHCQACRLWTVGEGRFGVQKVPCARTYHINVLLSVKSLAHGADDRSMVLQRYASLCCPHG